MDNHTIKLLVYDFDGVMTDNKIFIDQYGNEMVQVNRADGLAISEISKLGIRQLIISSEENTVVSERARKLNLPCLHGVAKKKEALIEYCEKNDVSISHVAYIGNDINDKEVMEIVRFRFCPANAHEEIKKISNFVLKTNGGDGVIRELFDFLKTRDINHE